MHQMVSLQSCLPTVLAGLLSRQPDSPAKVGFAWRAAVGDAIDRVTTVNLTDAGTLKVRATNQIWRREVMRLKPVILARLQTMLGRSRITRLVVDAPSEDRPRRRRRGESPAPDLNTHDR